MTTLTGSLEATTESEVDGSAVTLSFTVRNEGTEAARLQFADACKAEFIVEDEGREVWRFTDGRMFAQMLSAEELEPGEETTYEAEWENPRSGEFTAVAELRARETTCEARTELTV